MTQGAIDALVTFCKCLVVGGVIALIAWFVEYLEKKWRK